MIHGISDTTLELLADEAEHLESRRYRAQCRAHGLQDEADAAYADADRIEINAREIRILLAHARGETPPQAVPPPADQQARLLRVALRLAGEHHDLPAPEWLVDADGNLLRARFWGGGRGVDALRAWADALGVDVDANPLLTTDDRAYYQATATVHGAELRLEADGPREADEQPVAEDPAVGEEVA
ncbi:hypothetical protein CDO52_00990 [Nocardiopsis gilva YIM 90087]|uniref:Uncharacterized protein n=1 Tax=Nocardiopsis gilva YIM 90087 TaxID=1235441 RepID=A0A223S0A1_9ACTN|nr:hypothetical protein CDO52_00990 [Nocardiopsis gilva YIM 90087]